MEQPQGKERQDQRDNCEASVGRAALAAATERLFEPEAQSSLVF